MRELLLGWKDKSEVYIPPIKKQGFTEDVILRNINLPEEENLIPDIEENDETVLAENLDIDEDATVFAPFEVRCLILERVKTGKQIKVDSAEFTIGKQTENDYVIKDNPMISRKHARIYQCDYSFWLEDLNSLNHIFVNDKVISEPVKLIPGMKFRLSSDEEFKVIEITEN